MGSARVSDLEYWERLCYADVVVTTSDQVELDASDWHEVPNLVYRYLEVLVSGSLLVAQDVPGVARFFTPGIHYVGFNTPENAVEKISYYLDNSEERRNIAANGRLRAESLINSRIFWVSIDAMLSKDSLI